ncbi:MAG TPA: crossover junction endodeoxyribonuclease RuvC [Flavobacteriales bacterium]|nr:crossover junction endodeoxyribonuclease RuvC [Flavobacteriales bacterium]
MKEEKIIIGIDPGTNIMGYGIIKIIDKKITLLSMGSVHLTKIGDPYLKLKRIFDRTLALIDEYHPDEMAIEAPFYGKNVQSMLKLGRAQGVSISAALSRDISITEYMPKKVKMSITGNGNSSKEQVAAMLANILSYKEVPKHLDATDGLAVAVCHFFQGGSAQSSGKKYSGWDTFLKQNPGRKIT